MSIVVIGSGGQLGRDLCTRFGSRATALVRADVDLTDSARLRERLGTLAPRVVINAAAFNLVDDAEGRAIDAFAVNALAVRELARIANELDCVLVHFSSDYVFGLDQDRSTPYTESDVPGPLGVYASSKLSGEHFVRALCPRHFVIRTCGLYGLHGSGGKGRNFVETMLRVGKERGQVRVVNDQRCTPTFTVDLAEAVERLIATGAFGLYHWTNSGSCTWFEFAVEIFRQSGLVVASEPITSAEFGARALRPKYSVLATTKFESLGLPQPRPWQVALGAYLSARANRQPPPALAPA